MGKLPSYNDLQKRILDLENELLGLRAAQLNKLNDKNNIFSKICEYSKNAIAIFKTTDHGKSFIIKYFNEKAEDLEQVKRNDIIGKEASIVFPSIKQSGFLKTLKKVFKTGIPEEFPSIIISSNKILEWKHNYIYKLSETELVSIYMDVSKEKTKEQELQEHQNKLQIAMRAANYFWFEMDVPTNKITTQEEVYSSLGYPKYELPRLMKNSGTLIHPDDYKKTFKLLNEQYYRESPDFNLEFRIKNAENQWVWFSNVGKIMKWDKNDNPISILGLIKNIQKEKEFQAKLNQSEEKFKSLLSLLPEVIYETDIRGNLTFVNLKAYEIFEYTKEDFNKGLNILQMIAPEEIPRVKENLKRVFANKKVVGEEYIAISKTGKRFPILIYYSVKKDCGNITGLRGMIINITDRKNTLEKLRVSEEKFRQLSENIDLAFWLRSLNDEVIYSNPACYNILGEKFTEIFENFEVYKNWIHPEDREVITKIRNKNKEYPDKTYNYEHRIIKQNGDVRWLWIRTFPVYNNKGELYRRAGIASDITEQKNLVSELIIAKDKAEESDKLKSSFLANMSHEIRTPMNGVLGFIELLKDPDIAETEKNEFFNIIDINGKQLLNIINNILDIAIIESGEPSIKKTSFYIEPILKEVFLPFKKRQKQLKKENIKFTLHIPQSENQKIFTDSIRLQQILNNLIDNAFKFTDKGSIDIGYSIENFNNQDVFQFYVTDTGIGIGDAMKNQIFERFKQIESKKYLNRQGTGLGLAISKEFIELLGGKIWLESSNENNSGGSTFYFTIPINSTYV